MFCKHEWKVLSEITTESMAEHAANIGATINKGNETIMERKHIQIVTCSKCGKLKRFVENI